jgi:hypothetical protein
VELVEEKRLKYFSVILLIISLPITACTSEPLNSLSTSNQTSVQSPSITPYPTYTPEPTATPRPDGEVVVEITVYKEPWGIYGPSHKKWFSEEVVTTLSPGDSVKFLGKLGFLFWILVETQGGEQGWVRNDTLYDPCIHIDWKGSSSSTFFEPVGGCGMEADEWMYFSVFGEDIPTLPLRLPSGALGGVHGVLYGVSSSGEGNNLIVHNTTEQDAVIAIVNVDEWTLLSENVNIGSKGFLYIRAGEMSSIEGIAGGPYEVYVTLGTEWYPDYGAFEVNPSYWKLPEKYNYPYLSCLPFIGEVCREAKSHTINLTEVTGDTSSSTMITAAQYPSVNLPHPYYGED